jgi:hypothetical protein
MKQKEEINIDELFSFPLTIFYALLAFTLFGLDL